MMSKGEQSVHAQQKRFEFAIYFNVSPKGPTITTSLPSPILTTTVLFPHQTTWHTSPLPSPPRSNSDSDRVKSAEGTHSCGVGVEEDEAESSARKCEFGDGTIEAKGPLVIFCSKTRVCTDDGHDLRQNLTHQVLYLNLI